MVDFDDSEEKGSTTNSLDLKQTEEEKNPQRSVFRFLGIELTAPKELKYPIFILFGFVGINLALLLLLRRFLLLS